MTTDLHLPDYTTDTPTAYKGAIDEGFQNVERTAWSFAPHPASPTPNMTIDLNPGAIWNAGTLTEKAQQSTTTFVAPVTDPRIDRVVVDEVTGTLSIVAGSEAASPVAPAIPTGKFPVCQIQFETTTTSIGYIATATVAAITDERIPFVVAAGGGGELVFEHEVTGAAATTITVTGLDLDTDQTYDFVIEQLQAGTGGYVQLYANNLTTATDYYSQQYEANGTAITAARTNTARVGYANANSRSLTVGTISYVSGRYFSVVSLTMRDLGSAIIAQNRGMAKTVELVANLTQLDFTNTIASGFSIGSKLRIYKRA